MGHFLAIVGYHKECELLTIADPCFGTSNWHYRAFRDDYRQTIAIGQKASSDRSYHGGSFHGGYGHGQAADIVSVKGQTRAERLVSSDSLWTWIDTHEKELGIGRPYRDRDAPHVGPLDGREYLAHRVEPKSQTSKARLADRARRGDKNHQVENCSRETAC